MDSAAKAEIGSLVEAAEAPGAPLVATVNGVLRALERRGYVRHQTLEPQFIGVHPMNRDGAGVGWKDVHQLLRDVMDLGFDPAQPHPVCAECGPGMRNEALAFNNKLTSESAGRIPGIQELHLKYLSLSASHLNATLRVIQAGCPSDVESACVDGKVSFSKVELKDPQYSLASQQGLKWKVISHEVLAEWPQLATLVQAACNTGNQVAREEYEMQILLRIARLQQAAAKQGKSLEWDKLKADLQRSKPKCWKAMPYMFTFVRLFGGMEHIERTNHLVKSSSSGMRQLGEDFYKALSSEPKPRDSNPLVMMRHALLALAYTCPLDKFVGAADVNKIFSKQYVDACVKANKLLLEMATMLKKAVGPEQLTQVAQDVVLFESQAVMITLEKKHKDIELQESVELAALCFVDQIEAKLGVKLTGQFDALRAAQAAAKAAAASHHGTREFDSDGQLKDKSVLMKEAGFKIGQTIMRRQDKIHAVIRSIDHEKITVEHEGELFEAPLEAFLKHEWKIAPEERAKEMVDPKHLLAMRDLDLVAVKGKIAARLLELFESHRKCLSMLHVYSKPKSVEAAQEIPIGKLTLVPVTPNIQGIKAYDGTKPPTGYAVGLAGTPDTSFFLNQCFILPKDDAGFVAPFWLVSCTTDPDKANVELIDLVEPTFANKTLKHVPLIRNHKVIEEGDVLMRYVKAKEAVPTALKKLSTESEAAPSEPAQKRRKGKSAP